MYVRKMLDAGRVFKNLGYLDFMAAEKFMEKETSTHLYWLSGSN